jgi:signal transduction histidine kinase
MEQVFINLFQNAIDALQGESENAEIKVNINALPAKEAIEIKFNDNGPGMETSIREKVFEPFFTTKEVGQGTGLGLSIVYGIIKEHNGEITCESQINKGTSFTILIPLEKSKRREKA